MMPFRRRSAPSFWSEKESAYLAKRDRILGKDALSGWQHQNRKLARWFHDEVRSHDGPDVCVYCDAWLREATPETIDHFIPEHAEPELGLSWQNLYPACSMCNSGAKRTKWSCRALRPDVDLLPIEGETADAEAFLRWFSFDPMTGKIGPALGADPITKARARLTIGIFRLNETTRCLARRHRWQDLLNAAKHPQDDTRLEEMARLGPYRFVAHYFMTAYMRQPSLQPKLPRS